MLYFKSKTEKVYIPEYILSDTESIIVEYDGEYMKLNPNKQILSKQGTQFDLPFKDFILPNVKPNTSGANLYKYKRRHSDYFTLEKYDFKPNITKTDAFKGENHHRIFSQMHHSWFNLIQDEIDKPYFKELLNTIFTLKKKDSNIIPQSNNDLFSQFNQDLEDVKCIFLNNEIYDKPIPFIDGDHEVSKLFQDNLRKASSYNREIPLSTSNFNNIGVIGLNLSLSSNKNKKNEHLDIWKPFIKNTLFRLNSYFKDKVVYVLVGKQSLKYKDYINCEYHHIIEVDHPSKSIKDGTEWLNIDVFKFINDKVNIKW